MQIAFLIMAIIIIASAIGVIAAINPIHSALCLVLNLLTVAAVFASLDAHFLAAVQVVVYAGAIMVLVIFVLMLLNIKVENPKRMALGTFLGALLTGMVFLVVTVPLLNESFKVFHEPTRNVIGSVANIGKVLYSAYVYPFEVASILIMAAIVGAVMLSKRKPSAIKGQGVK